MTYESVKLVDSATVAGVKFAIARMSFGRRVELMRKVRELARKIEFLTSSEHAGDKMDAALLQSEIDRVHVSWGLKSVSGLVLDGAEATPEMLAEAGPEELFREALAFVKAETGLTDAERKN